MTIVYIICGLVGLGAGYLLTLAVQKTMATSRAKTILENAGREIGRAHV